MFEHVIYEKSGKIARLIMNRPEKLNALNVKMFGELVAGLKMAEEDDDIKVIILKGNGRSFSTGHDLSEVGFVYGFSDGKSEEGRRKRPSQRVRLQFDRKLLEMYQAFMYSMKPIIAQVQGHAIGGGLYLTEVVDLAIAAEDASFSHAEQRLMGGGRSLIGNTEILLLGPKRAREFLLFGEPMSGVRAAEVGLINKAVPADLLEAETERWAERLARHPKDALVVGKVFQQMALDSLGYTSQMMRGYVGHTLSTNMRFEDDEYNYFKGRRDEGARGAMHSRDRFFTEAQQ
ncbi:enoyl-CoA hydratase/isomerase family protein [Streptosporangium amethystogenes]|uniref:enoyl-CoA hydratase/isomerase family protein n=1 Tax=Streptosporangium amethystogenes TaxID=2002 RepID=UPI00068DF062|nr:enoyl-CoA hydratase/isomerase family protein [Streptosporangium amethystogenes]